GPFHHSYWPIRPDVLRPSCAGLVRVARRVERILIEAATMRLCFTIRDLLWLTLVVALGLGWVLDHHFDRYHPWVIQQNNGHLTLTNKNNGMNYELSGDYPHSPTLSKPSKTDD